MYKKVYNLDKQEDIDELNRLIFEENLDDNADVPQEELDEQSESENEDILETRSVDSDTDHEVDEEGLEEVETEEESGNFYMGEWKVVVSCYNRVCSFSVYFDLSQSVSQ